MRALLISIIIGLGSTAQAGDDMELSGRALNYASGDLRFLALRADEVGKLAKDGRILLAFDRNYISEVENKEHPTILKLKNLGDLKSVLSEFEGLYGITRPENISIVHYTYSGVKRYFLSSINMDEAFMPTYAGDIIIIQLSGDLF